METGMKKKKKPEDNPSEKDIVSNNKQASWLTGWLAF